MSAPASSAYAHLLGIRPARDGEDRPLREMAPGDTVMGRPSAMHGGAVASLMEQAGRATVEEVLAAGNPDSNSPGPAITLVSMTVDYLRAAPMRECRARGEVVKMGGRVANISVEAWADDPAKPIAAARLTYLIVR